MRRVFTFALICCTFAFSAIAGDAKAQSPEDARARAEATVAVAKATLSLKDRSARSAGCQCETCRCIDCVCESQQRFATEKAMKVVEDAKITLKTIPAPPAVRPLSNATFEPPLSKAVEPRFSADKKTMTYDDGRTFTLRSDGTYWQVGVASSPVVSVSPCVNGQCPNVR